MATGKKSFLLYCDIVHTIEQLTNEQAGTLFKHILNYVNDRNPEIKDALINIAFEPIKQQLKRDLKRYELIIERNKINGLKGGRPHKNNPLGYLGTQITQANPEEPKKADNDTDNDTDILKGSFFNLTEPEIKNTIEFIDRTTQKKYSGKEIINLFAAFKLQYEKEFYLNRNKVIQHFRNWLKLQKSIEPEKSIIPMQNNFNGSAPLQKLN